MGPLLHSRVWALCAEESSFLQVAPVKSALSRGCMPALESSHLRGK